MVQLFLVLGRRKTAGNKNNQRPYSNVDALGI